MRKALIIFIRKPELGKVKTRLAATVGDQRALAIYLELLQHTKQVAISCDCDKYVFSDGIIDEEEWSNFSIQQQSKGNLGERMSSAFDYLFQKDYEKVIIIGSDCLELSNHHLTQAFLHLNDVDFVIGPANDGGYYLLGMKKNHADIFSNKKWGNDSVFFDTLRTAEKLKLTTHQLEYLNDIDEEKDLPDSMRG